MTEKTYTLEVIDQHIANHEAKFELAAQSGSQYTEAVHHSAIAALKALKKELTRPKHNFAEGQVVYNPVSGLYSQILVAGHEPTHCRPLRLTEAGPPYQEVIGALIDTRAGRLIINGAVAKDLLKEFYQEISDE